MGGGGNHSYGDCKSHVTIDLDRRFCKGSEAYDCGTQGSGNKQLSTRI